jgi:hypothetical protein
VAQVVSKWVVAHRLGRQRHVQLVALVKGKQYRFRGGGPDGERLALAHDNQMIGMNFQHFQQQFRIIDYPHYSAQF